MWKRLMCAERCMGYRGTGDERYFLEKRYKRKFTKNSPSPLGEGLGAARGRWYAAIGFECGCGGSYRGATPENDFFDKLNPTPQRESGCFYASRYSLRIPIVRSVNSAICFSALSGLSRSVMTSVSFFS